MYGNKIIYLAGNASPPTITSVMYRSPSALVSFQPPVYGAECVAYYTVTAISEERNVTCNVTSDEYVHNCSIPDANVYDYLFTVYSVAEGIDTFYHGGIDMYCSKFN